MQFKVPQFLDIEDKIFGPFTFKEFAYLVGGGGLCYVLYKLLGLLYGAIPILLVAGFAGTLTFYRPNNKPFINILEASFKYAVGDKLYIWKRRKAKKITEEEKEKTEMKKMELLNKSQTKLGGSKLKDLSWSLDVLDLNKEQEGQ